MVVAEEMHPPGAESTSEQEPETVSVKEFADALGWDTSTVGRAIRSGRVKVANKKAPGLKRIPEYRILKSEIQRLKDEAAQQS